MPFPLHCPTPALCERAKRIADRHGFIVVAERPVAAHLSLDEAGLALLGEDPAIGAVRADFLHGRFGYRARRLSIRGEPLARAAGLKSGERPRILDATAGLGRDAFVLAALGCKVVLVERCGPILALLADGIERLSAKRPEIAARMRLVGGDARRVLTSLAENERPDAVVLDPMYPHAERDAAARKEMRLFRDIVGDDSDADALLAAALGAARRRVIVKRPLRAPPLAGQPPHHAVEGGSTRFDVYLVAD